MQGKMNRPPFSPYLFLVASLLIAVAICAGCKTEAKPKAKAPVTELPPDPLTLMVVGDAELGPIVKRQWAARRDGVLTIVDESNEDFVAEGFKIPAGVDVVIYPPAMLGELHITEQIIKVPGDVFNSNEFNKNEMLRHFRTLVARHDDQNFAIPLGGPGYSMIFNASVLEKAQTEPPATWKSFDSCLRKISKALQDDPDTKLVAKVDMPLAKNWAAHSFLARAAPAIAERGKLSTVLDRSTMKPLITEVPFVESLEQLKEIASSRSLELDPRGVYDLVCRGDSAVAIGWPAKGFSVDPESKDAENALATDLLVVSLPGMTERYDSSTGNWAKRSGTEEFRVDTIGFGGFIGSVAATTEAEESSWELLSWLGSKQIGLLVMPESPSAGPFRASHLGDPSVWAGERISEGVADQYSEVIAANHERTQAMIFPRIPGHQRYLAALDNAVRDCVAGEKTAEEALQFAAQEWDKITDELGRKAQSANLKKTRTL